MRPTVLSRRAAAAALVLLAPAALRAQGTISTLPAWSPSDMLGGIGIPGSSAVGQTFVAPDASAMTGFSLFLDADRLSARPGDLRFRAYLHAWNGTRAEGAALYASGVQQGIATQGATRFDFDFAPVALAAGSEYVLYISRLGLADAMGPEPDANNEFGYVRAHSGYAAGQVVYYDVLDGVGDDPARVTIDPWTKRPDIDLAFEARFAAATTAPEPATVTLLGGGVAGLALVARRRRGAR